MAWVHVEFSVLQDSSEVWDLRELALVLKALKQQEIGAICCEIELEIKEKRSDNIR